MQPSTLPLAHPDRQATTADHLFTLALVAATTAAKAKYGFTARLVKGFQLALAGKVSLLENGAADVASQFGTTTYTVNGVCPCPDARQHGREHICKHRWAKSLTRRAHTLLAANALEEMGGVSGARCPDCGQATVVEAPIWGKHTGHFWHTRLCRMVLTVGEARYACGWREMHHAGA